MLLQGGWVKISLTTKSFLDRGPIIIANIINLFQKSLATTLDRVERIGEFKMLEVYSRKRIKRPSEDHL